MTNASVLIVYGSVSGNTELVAQKITEILESKNISVKLSRVEKTSAQELLDPQFIILASPTYYHGDTEAHFPKFLEEAKEASLQGKPFAVVGLGDKKYYPEYLCDAAKVLEDFITEVNGVMFAPSLRIGTSPIGLLDSMVKNWADRVALKIKP